MATDLIHDRGRGPEIAGTRITVYNLLPHFMDPGATETDICRLYDLEPEQVAAARAYVLNNADVVLLKHLQIEARMAAGNPPEVVEKAKQTHETLLRFKQWLDQSDTTEDRAQAAETATEGGGTNTRRLPTFKEWLAEEETRPKAGS